MDEKQVEEYTAPVNEAINSNPTEEDKKKIESQDSHDPENVAPIVEVK